MLFVFLVLRVSLGLAGFALAYFMARARSFRPEHRLLAALGVLVGLESVWAIAESFGNHGPRFLNGEPWMTVVLVAVAATALGLFARRKRTFSFSTGSIDRDGTNGSEPEAEKGLSSVPRQTRHLDADWRDVVDCLPVGIVWIAGPSLQVQMWNRYEAQRTGIEARQVLGKRYLDQVAERHLDGRLVEAIRAKPQEIVTFPSVSWSVQGESGIETTIVPFRSEHEQEGYLIVTFDTTERDAYFREREEVRKQAALREFASAIAHDIRTPLSSIRMSVQILRSKAVLSPEDMEYFDLTLEQISRLGTDIDELLVFTKPALLEVKPVLLRELVEDAREQVLSAMQRDVAIVIDVPCELKVPVDEEQVHRMLLDLLRNAVSASPSGSRVWIAAHQERDEVTILVRDEGHGIESCDLERIWEPHFKKQADGTGLGLALVRKIVTAHGGRVTVHSECGRGSTFTVVLPASRATEVVVPIEECQSSRVA